MTVTNHAIQAVTAAAGLDQQLHAAQQRAKAAKQAAKEAELAIKEFAKARRDEARKLDRRALVVGRVVLTLAAGDDGLWDDLWPHVVTTLTDAKDDERALFGLPLRHSAPAEPPPDTDRGEPETAAIQ